MSDETLTRRERQRHATMEELVRTAREQLPEPGGLSLRAIAQEMGMTPPALYRYVASAEELTLIVAGSIYDDLVDVMRQATERHPAGPEAQIVAAAIAYRQWSLQHRDEFGLCFVNDVANPGDPRQNACAVAGDRFRRFFADLFIEIYRRNPFEVPDDGQMADVADLLADETNPFVDEHREPVAADVPIGAQWLFLQVWTRLFGIVALEAFGHIAPPLVESGALFGAVVRDGARMLGFDVDSPDIRAVVDAELRR